MLTIILAYFCILVGIIYFFILIRSYLKEKEHEIKSKKKIAFYGIAEIFVWFLATLGVSDTAVNSLIYPIKDTVKIKMLPGTIIVGATIPMCFMSYSYLTEVKVSPITLGVLVAAQAVGSFAGASLVSKMNGHMIRLFMGSALVATAFILLFKNYILNVEGGRATELSLIKLIFAMFFMFATGVLNMIGFGSTTPNIAMLLMLGMNPISIYPIVMCANTFTCIAGCVEFIKNEMLHKQLVVVETITGMAGVFLAMKFVANIEPKVLQILMIFVMLFSAFQMFRTDYKEQKAKK